MRKITIVAIVMAVCGMVSVSCSKEEILLGSVPLYDNLILSYTNLDKPCSVSVGSPHQYNEEEGRWQYVDLYKAYPNHFARITFSNDDSYNNTIRGVYTIGQMGSNSKGEPIISLHEKIRVSSQEHRKYWDIYDSLMYAHSDMNMWEKRGTSCCFTYENITYTPIKKVTVTSSKDYDAAHPAGTDLADVLDISFMSLSEVLANDFDYDKIKIGKKHNSSALVIKEPLSQFNTENRKLLSWMYGLYARKQPVEKSGHVITVTMEFADGNVFTSTSKPLDIF